MLKCAKLGLFLYFDLKEKEKQDETHILAEVHYPNKRK